MSAVLKKKCGMCLVTSMFQNWEARTKKCIRSLCGQMWVGSMMVMNQMVETMFVYFVLGIGVWLVRLGFGMPVLPFGYCTKHFGWQLGTTAKDLYFIFLLRRGLSHLFS